jgi:integrase
MANLRNRDGKWQAQVRRAGHKPRTMSFLSKADAQRWARQMEAELDRAAIPNDTRRLDTCSIADVMNRYKVTPKKRGAASELKRIEVFLRASWTGLPLSKATPAVFSDYRNKRLKQVRPGTVLRELGLLRAIFETAMREWEHPLVQNPIANLKKPRAPEGRDRRLRPGELAAIVSACADGRSDWLLPAVYFAVETGMRRGELLKMRWRDVDALRLSWERCKKRAAKLGTPEVQSLRFHDLRHEAVSWFFEMGLNTAGAQGSS